MEKMKKTENIIQVLSKHKDRDKAVNVLTEIGTNSPDDAVRELTAKALIRMNTQESLKTVLLLKGKGINDLSEKVALSAIKELLALKDKTKAIEILDEALETFGESDVKNALRSVKTLLTFN